MPSTNQKRTTQPKRLNTLNFLNQNPWSGKLCMLPVKFIKTSKILIGNCRGQEVDNLTIEVGIVNVA